VPDFTRYGKGQREQMLGQTLGLPTTMIAFSAMGVVITSASQAILKGVPVDKLWDPVFILSQLTSPTAPPGLDAPLIASSSTRLIVAIIALFGVAVATISVNIAANVVSPANDFANLAPRLISFKTGGLITGILGIFIMPWKLLASADTYIFNWLVGYSALLGPIAGIMVVDYWILRKRKLDVPDLYRENGQYGGTNWVAIGALVVGVLPNVPGFLKSAKLVGGEPSFWDAIYVYAWFTGFFLAGILYFVGMKQKRAAGE
jgi:nucleobase:cation symporter-1, NCS1 family